MNNVRNPALLCFLGALLGLALKGQEVGVYLSSSFDPSSESAYAYAETTADYSTGYYYDVCTAIDALGEEDDYDGSYDYYESSTNCGSTDAAVSWYFTAAPTTDYISFTGNHMVDIEYYDYQFDEYCGAYCYDYYDAYEASLLAGGDYGSGSEFDLPGPPPYLVGDQMVTLFTYLENGTFCYYPYSETSTYQGAYLLDGESDAASFSVAVYNFGGAASYTGRTVMENITLTGTDQCYAAYPGMYDEVTNANFDDSYSWGLFGSAYGGYDYMSMDAGAVSYYMEQLGYNTCNLFTGTQQMTISSCREPLTPWFNYSTNSIGYDIAFYGAWGWRQSASGSAIP